jgi:hypothetical protein
VSQIVVPYLIFIQQDTLEIGMIRIFMSKSVFALYPINIHREDRDEGAAGQHRRIKQAPCMHNYKIKRQQPDNFRKIIFLYLGEVVFMLIIP